MPEMLNGKLARADVVEWRLARPEDGPVWVALTRDGRTPLVPREALAEPDHRLLRDQQEQHDELARYVHDPLEQRQRRFLLWRSNRPLGRLCFDVRDAQARLEGIALLPSAEREVIEQVARAAVERAREAGARSIRATYEARHAPAFLAAGFQELRRYTPMMAATRQIEEDGEGARPVPVSMIYSVRPLAYEDNDLLNALYHDTSQGKANGRRTPTDWLAKMAQLLAESDNGSLPECSVVAELHQKHKLAGAAMVSRWQGTALLDELVVPPRYKHWGIAAALVRQALQELHQRGYVTVMLVVTEGDPVQEFYQQLGFHPVQPSYVEAECALPAD